MTGFQRDQGMVCPICGSDQTRVADSRPVGGVLIRRRRACLNNECEFRWNTMEFPMSDWAMVSVIGFAMGDRTKRHSRKFALGTRKQKKKLDSPVREA